MLMFLNSITAVEIVSMFIAIVGCGRKLIKEEINSNVVHGFFLKVS